MKKLPKCPICGKGHLNIDRTGLPEWRNKRWCPRCEKWVKIEKN